MSYRVSDLSLEFAFKTSQAQREDHNIAQLAIGKHVIIFERATGFKAAFLHGFDVICKVSNDLHFEQVQALALGIFDERLGHLHAEATPAEIF